MERRGNPWSSTKPWRDYAKKKSRWRWSTTSTRASWKNSNYIHYWEYWAAATGGQAIVAEEGTKSLDSKLTEIIKESAEGIPPCPPGFERTTTTPCVKKPTTPPPPPPHSSAASAGARQRLHDREHRGKCRRNGLDHVHPDPAGHRNAGRESADGIDRQRLGHRRQGQAVQGRARSRSNAGACRRRPRCRRGIRQRYRRACR